MPSLAGWRDSQLVWVLCQAFGAFPDVLRALHHPQAQLLALGRESQAKGSGQTAAVLSCKQRMALHVPNSSEDLHPFNSRELPGWQSCVTPQGLGAGYRQDVFWSLAAAARLSKSQIHVSVINVTMLT